MRKLLGYLVIPAALAGLLAGAYYYNLWRTDPRRALEDFVIGVVKEDPDRAFDVIDHEKLVVMNEDFGAIYKERREKNPSWFKTEMGYDLKAMAKKTWMPAPDTLRDRLSKMEARPTAREDVIEFVDRATDPRTVYIFVRQDGKWKLSRIQPEY